MLHSDGRSLLRVCAAILLFTAVACSDHTGSTTPRQRFNPQARMDISDGAHGGNRDVFFLPPMLGNPNKAAGYGDPFQPGLNVSIKVRDVTANTYVTTFAPSAVSVNTVDGYYFVNWDTKASNLDPAHVYRVEVWV